ncbi:MAG: hypothetical protein HXS54_03435 [Theionarchaea archaeon]|nr:hypothetical protein [Theionarchaea archaeon]
MNTDLKGTVQLKSPTRETLSEIAAKIVKYFHPEKIIPLDHMPHVILHVIVMWTF